MLILSALYFLQALKAFPLERKKIKFSSISSGGFVLGIYFFYV